MSVFTRLFAVGVILAVVAPSPAETPKDAPFAVKVVGKGKPMILIPGLTCSGEVWNATVDHFKDRYECHVLTLAGFAGQPPVKGPFLETMRQGIVDYIKAKKLDKPVIVGHSLGGFLVYRLAQTEPDLVGPVIAVDGMPCFAALVSPSEPNPETMKKQGAAMQTAMANSPREAYLKNQRMFVGGWLEGREELETVLKWGADSDQATAARAMGELFSQDARPDLGRIKSPVLQLAAFDKAGLGRYGVTRESLTKRVETQIAAVPKHELAVAECRHFIMYEQPEWMWKTMDAFLAQK
jgi:pimeloyl-ACP methyl ester carboxylesterase